MLVGPGVGLLPVTLAVVAGTLGVALAAAGAGYAAGARRARAPSEGAG